MRGTPQAAGIQRPYRRGDAAHHRHRGQEDADLARRARDHVVRRDAEGDARLPARRDRDPRSRRAGAGVGVAAVDQHCLRPSTARVPGRDHDRRRLHAIAREHRRDRRRDIGMHQREIELPTALDPARHTREAKPAHADRRLAHAHLHGAVT